MSYIQRRYENVVPLPGVEGGIPVAVNPHILASNMQLMRVLNQLSKDASTQEDKAANDPSITSEAHSRMLWRVFLMESILGGTETMRAAGKTLLPMYTGEKQSDWQTRLSQAVLFNYAERTSEDLTGRLFKTPPKIPTPEDGLDPILVKHFNNVNGAGVGFTEFLFEWFKKGFNYGLYHVLVNTPKADSDTRASDRKTPTWSFIHPDNLLFAHQTTLPDGTVIIDHARILETRTEMQGFRETTARFIRVIEVGQERVYRENPKARGKDDKWYLVEAFQTDWDRVPLLTFYGGKKIGFMEAIPALQDLAYLNVRHWQSYSDQANILTVARFPILAASGTSGGRGSKTIGPKKLFRIPDASGKLMYVEHTGAAIKSGQDDLEMLEHMMSNYGSEFLKSRPGSTAATTRAIDSSESTSSLVSTANVFEDAVHELLIMTMRAFESFDNDDEVPRVEFVVDLSISAIDSTELSTLDLARRRKDLSRKGFLAELARRDILADTFDADADFTQLEKEIKAEIALGIFQRENEFAIPNAENLSDRNKSGKSTRDKPDNGKGDTGEGDDAKDATLD